MNSKKMNLLPISYQREYEVDTNAFLRKVLVSLFIVSFVVFIFLGKYQLYSLNREIDSLEIQHTQLAERNASLLAIDEELKLLEDQWRQYDKLGIKIIPLNKFIEDITRATPADVWYTSIELIKDESMAEAEQENMHFNINGYSQAISSVGNLAYLLNQLPYMQPVTIDRSSEITVDNVSLFEFYLQGEITR